MTAERENLIERLLDANGMEDLNFGQREIRGLLTEAADALAAVPSAPVAPEVDGRLTRDQVVDAIQDAWNDFVADTGNYPDAFEHEGRDRFRLNAGRGNWASWITDDLNRRLASGVPSTPQAPDERDVVVRWDTLNGDTMGAVIVCDRCRGSKCDHCDRTGEMHRPYEFEAYKASLTFTPAPPSPTSDKEAPSGVES